MNWRKGFEKPVTIKRYFAVLKGSILRMGDMHKRGSMVVARLHLTVEWIAGQRYQPCLPCSVAGGETGDEEAEGF